MKLINPCNSGGGSSPVLAIVVGDTRTQAQYQPAAQGVVAFSSDFDIVQTIPAGCTKAHLQWDIMCEAEIANGSTGFVVYKDEDGGGFTLMPNARDGSANYYSVITCPNYDNQFGITPSTSTVSITDESPTVGAVTTYRVYACSTAAAAAGNVYVNKAGNTVGSGVESGLTAFKGLFV